MTGRRLGVERQLGKVGIGQTAEEAALIERQAGSELLLLLKGNGQSQWKEAPVRHLRV